MQGAADASCEPQFCSRSLGAGCLGLTVFGRSRAHKTAFYLGRDRKVSLLQSVGELWSSSKPLPLPLHFFSKKKFMNEFLSQPISRTKASPKPRCGPSTPHSAWPPCWFPAPRFLTDQLVPLPPPGRRGLSSGQLHEVPTDKKSVAATDGPKDQGRKKPLQIPRQALEVGVCLAATRVYQVGLPLPFYPSPSPSRPSVKERTNQPSQREGSWACRC